MTYAASFRRNEGSPRPQGLPLRCWKWRKSSNVWGGTRGWGFPSAQLPHNSRPALHIASICSAAMPSGLSQEKQKCNQLKKTQHLSLSMWLGVSPGLCPAAGPTQDSILSSFCTVTGHPYSDQGCWGDVSFSAGSFWSAVPSHCFIGARQETAFVGDPFLARPPRGCRRKQGQSDTLPALIVVRNFGNELWEDWKSVTWFLLAILSLGQKLNRRPPEQGLPSTSSDLCKQKGKCFPSWQEWMWQQRRNERGRRTKSSTQRWHPWG